MNIVFENKDGYLFGYKPNSSEKPQSTTEPNPSVVYLSNVNNNLYGYKA